MAYGKMLLYLKRHAFRKAPSVFRGEKQVKVLDS